MLFISKNLAHLFSNNLHKAKRRSTLTRCSAIAYFLLKFELISDSASEASISQLQLRAMSHSVTMPTSLPSSSTGNRRTWSADMSRTAFSTSSKGSAVIIPRLITSLTFVSLGSAPAATQHFIQDNYVKVMEMYDEREDFAKALFGITTTLPETIDYWDE